MTSPTMSYLSTATKTDNDKEDSKTNMGDKWQRIWGPQSGNCEIYVKLDLVS